MERIQSAIQKARKNRAQQSSQKQNSDSAPDSSLQLDPETNQPGLTLIPDEQENLWTQVPELKLKPQILHRAHVVSDQAGTSAAPFDAMRTRMLHQMRANKWSRIAITSPGSSCGKTTLCMNLAFSLARQRDLKTMVLDLDMRKPAISRTLGLQEQLNFPDALRANSLPEEHMICHDGRLIFAVASKPTENPAELLQEKGAAHAIDDVEKRYTPNVMLFDTPPMLACDDTFAFLDQIDSVLLVADAESTTVEELKKCTLEIEARSNLMGVVLNKCHYLNKEDSYGY